MVRKPLCSATLNAHAPNVNSNIDHVFIRIKTNDQLLAKVSSVTATTIVGKRGACSRTRPGQAEADNSLCATVYKMLLVSFPSSLKPATSRALGGISRDERLVAEKRLRVKQPPNAGTSEPASLSLSMFRPTNSNWTLLRHCDNNSPLGVLVPRSTKDNSCTHFVLQSS